MASSDVNFDTVKVRIPSPASGSGGSGGDTYPLVGTEEVTVEHTMHMPTRPQDEKEEVTARPQDEEDVHEIGWKQSKFQRAATGLLARASTGLDKSNLLPRTEHERNTFCTFRACLFSMWFTFLLVFIILISLALSNQREVNEVKQITHRTEAAEADMMSILQAAYCPVLSVFNADCKSCLSKTFETPEKVVIRCGSWNNGINRANNGNCRPTPCIPALTDPSTCGSTQDPRPCCINAADVSAGFCLQQAAIDNTPPLTGITCGFPGELDRRTNICPLPGGLFANCSQGKFNPGVTEGALNAFCCPQTIVDVTSDIWQQYTCYNGAFTGDAAQNCVPLGSKGWCTVCTGANCGGGINLGR
eukprot:gb/GEZN01006720.1/.p1 GENE.gb/GEZN01006720.1/~~gb/GEZN01006720.1/.p1  ORF type:complete len:360 (-),score=25.60 gb/GEZN01006720.1/:492-1571(-)